MDKEADGSSSLPVLPPPPPIIPPNVKPEKLGTPKDATMTRPGFGNSGRRISLQTNHVKVSIRNPDGVFYQYSVSISSDDRRAVESKGIGRKLIDKLYQTYSSEVAGKKCVYDGEKCLYTLGHLQQYKLEFTVVLEESFSKRSGSPSHGSPSEPSKSSKRSFQSKTFKVELSDAVKIPLKSISLALQGVLDIILQQQAVYRGCLLVRQSFFHDNSRNLTDVGGGVTGCCGYHSSSRPTHGGLCLNMDVTTTMILTPGCVIKFLKSNQNVQDESDINWLKAKRMLKNTRVQTVHSKMEFKIIGLTEEPYNQQMFSLKVKCGDNRHDDGEVIEITVSEYFTKYRKIELTRSAYMPCLNVGKLYQPNYLPLELCSLFSLQPYTKGLSSMQRASLVEKSRQKPPERMEVLIDAVRNYRYDDHPLLAACGISIEKQLTQVDGRVLEAPRLKIGNSEDCVPWNRGWNFNNKVSWFIQVLNKELDQMLKDGRRVLVIELDLNQLGRIVGELLQPGGYKKYHSDVVAPQGNFSSFCKRAVRRPRVSITVGGIDPVISSVLVIVTLAPTMLCTMASTKSKRRYETHRRGALRNYREHGQKGFYNPGNSCYAIVALQSFLSLDCVVEEFQSIQVFGPTTYVVNDTLFRDVPLGSLTNFFKATKLAGLTISDRTSDTPTMIFGDGRIDPDTRQEYIGLMKVIKEEHPSISNLFGGWLRIRNECRNCNAITHKTKWKRSFYFQDLCRDPGAEPQDIIETFLDLFHVTNETTKYCENCGSEEDCDVNWCLTRENRVLILEFDYTRESDPNRLRYGEQISLDHDTFRFPRTAAAAQAGIVAAEAEAEDEAPQIYNLKAVVQSVPRGLSGNHFVAFVRRTIDNNPVWFRADDYNVEQSTRGAVLEMIRPKILFYELS